MANHCNKTLQHNIATLQYNIIDGVETCVVAVHRDKRTSLSQDKPRQTHERQVTTRMSGLLREQVRYLHVIDEQELEHR